MKRAALLCAALGIGCGGTQPNEAPPAAASPVAIDSSTTLSVEGRSSATPSVASAGSLVAVAWGASASGKADVVVAVSRDSGRTFAAPVYVDASGTARLGGEFPPRVAVRPAASGRIDEAQITVLWTAHSADLTSIRIAQSRDGGRTFSAARELQRNGAPGARGWPSLAVDTSGAAHAVWLDHRGLAAAGGQSHHHGAASPAAVDGVAAALKSGLYYASLDGAAPAEREVAPGVCYCCKTAFAAGPDGALFSAWRHVYPGNLRDIAFAVSRDSGRSFSAPARVSEDGWRIDGCPDDGPAMVVDAGGVAHIAWPSVVQGAKTRGAIFYASTRDGVTFTPRVEVPSLGSVKPSHAQIAIDAEGRMAVAWDEHLDGRRVTAVRALRRDAEGRVTFGAVLSLASSDAAYYPALAAIDGGFIAVWTDAGDSSSIGVRTFALE